MSDSVPASDGDDLVAVEEGIRPPVAVMVTFSNPAVGVEDQAFNRWYDDEHVPSILQNVAGISRVTRFRAATEADPGAPGRFLAIYEFDRPAAEVLGNFAAAGDAVSASELLGAGDLAPVTFVYEAIDPAS